MPRRKSDATDGEAVVPATGDSIVPDGDVDSTSPAPEPDEAALLSTPDVAAEPGSPDATEPPPAAEPWEAAEPYREPQIVGEPAPDVERAAAEPPVAAAPVAETADEVPEDEGGSSFAARALTALLLLLLGGGLALWGAPKLAPHLPSGMSGVASWLAPGQRDAEARIAELEARLQTGLGGLEARVADLASADDIDARIAAALAAAEARFDDEIAAVQESVARLGSSDVPQQIARLDSSVQGQSAELATLKQQLAGTETATGQLTQETVAKIDVYSAELNGLRAEVGTLQDRVAGLTTRVDEAVASAGREIETARAQVEQLRTESDTRLSAAEAEANLALVRAAIASGAPFEEPLAAIAAAPGISVPAGLTAAAPSGVAPLARLRDDYSDAAHAAIRASILAGAGEGVVARSRAFFEAQMASRSLRPQPGASPDAVLSRVEDRLRQDDLDGALAEAGQLPPEAQAAMGPWLDAARLRAGALDGLGELDAALSATN